VQHVLGELIPAQPDTFIWRFWEIPHGERPTGIELWQEKVFAWLLDRADGFLTPISWESSVHTERYLIRLDNGRLHWPIDHNFEDMEEAKTAILKYAQDEWDRMQERMEKLEAKAKAGAA
jgi:hypothetical protein